MVKRLETGIAGFSLTRYVCLRELNHSVNLLYKLLHGSLISSDHTFLVR